MYPLTRWTYEELSGRLEHLAAYRLYPELVVISCQVTEQVILRHLVREINRQRRIWVTREAGGWRQLTTPAERDQELRWLQGPEAWKPVWRKQLHEQCGLPPLDQAFNQTVGPASWNILIGDGKLPLLPSQSANDAPLLYGLRPCRNKLVHGKHSPPQRELQLLGPWGAEAVKRLLHPETGWPNILGWSAQARLPAFRVASRSP